jgi:hypothetical protein
VQKGRPSPHSPAQLQWVPSCITPGPKPHSQTSKRGRQRPPSCTFQVRWGWGNQRDTDAQQAAGRGPTRLCVCVTTAVRPKMMHWGASPKWVVLTRPCTTVHAPPRTHTTHTHAWHRGMLAPYHTARMGGGAGQGGRPLPLSGACCHCAPPCRVAFQLCAGFTGLLLLTRQASGRVG